MRVSPAQLTDSVCMLCLCLGFAQGAVRVVRVDPPTLAVVHACKTSSHGVSGCRGQGLWMGSREED